MLDQNRALWDQLLIHRGLSALARAEELSRALGTTGTYTLQAAIPLPRSRRHRRREPDWPRIAALYSALAQVAPSPIVELNRAVAVGMAEGPAPGSPSSMRSQRASTEELPPAPQRRADLLRKLGRYDESPRRLSPRRFPEQNSVNAPCCSPARLLLSAPTNRVG